ncbi:phage antirepressor KilAC domain-containing protein [Bacillus thuringiensis]|nr:phage antirepressor KilAC domain-containing protein [Bacillus thuringiensis]
MKNLLSKEAKQLYKHVIVIPATEDQLIENTNVHMPYLSRTEVLDRVGSLLLLEGTEFATTKQVAAFYDVPHETVRKIIERQGDELRGDGMYLATYREIKEVINGQYVTLLENGVSKRGTYVFPKRAILRVGLLLRDSEIAKAVRDQLLNIEEDALPADKVKAINAELDSIRMKKTINTALESNDIDVVKQALTEVGNYQDSIFRDNTISFTVLARELHVSAKELREFLQFNGVLYEKQIDGHYISTKQFSEWFEVKSFKIRGKLRKSLKITGVGVENIKALWQDEVESSDQESE